MARIDEAKAFNKLVELIHQIEVAMLTTAEPDGTLRSRPMMTQNTPFDGKLAFFTREHSAKVDEVQHDRHVNLAYSDPKAQRYVSVSGTAIVTRDAEKIRAMWKPAYRAWFPQGLDDPELALLEISVEQAEYWDTHQATMVHLIGLASAALTGKAAAPGEHQTLHFDTSEPAPH